MHLFSGLQVGHLIPGMELICLQSVCVEVILVKPVQRDLL